MTDCLNDSLTNSIIILLILILEAWLGKTQKTKSGSILELLFLGTLSLIVFITIKKGEKNV